MDARKAIQMTHLEAPKFDGKARNYLRFKQRFEELVTTQFDSMAQLEYLEKGFPHPEGLGQADTGPEDT